MVRGGVKGSGRVVGGREGEWIKQSMQVGSLRGWRKREKVRTNKPGGQEWATLRTVGQKWADLDGWAVVVRACF